jgi:hypothetical protein
VGHESAHLLTTVGNSVIDEAVLSSLVSQLVGPHQAFCCRDAIHTLAGPASPEDADTAYAEIERCLAHAPAGSSHRVAQRLAYALRRAYILWVPVIGHEGDRQIAHIDYVERFQTRRRSRAMLRAARTLAWGGGDEYVTIPHVGQHGSYHIDVETTPGLRMEDADLYFLYEEPRDGEPSPEIPEVDVQITDERAHLYTVAERPGSAVARVRMMPTWRGFLAGAFIAALGIAALLTAFWRWAPELVHDPTSSVAILVIVPALLGLIALRPTAHPLVFSRLFGVQLLMYLAGTLSVFSALVAIRYAHQVGPAHALWRDCAVASYVVLAMVGFGFARAARRW